MRFIETPLKGAYVIDIDPRRDARGFFARAFCQTEFAAHGLQPAIAQVNVAANLEAGTRRGLHFQYPPAADSKLVRCIRGALLDVLIDLRPESPTYLQHHAVELTADSYRAVYLPERFAHGYQTLADDTHMVYYAGAPYSPAAEGGLRHDDPRLAIQWPGEPGPMSDKDREWPLLQAIEPTLRERMAGSDR